MIRNTMLFFSFLLISLSIFGQNARKAPAFAIGNFTDDYGLKYEVNDTVWIQSRNIKYNIIKWVPEKQYLIAKNASTNKFDAGKYTRIDYMTFENMGDWKWGFCLTAYKAETDEIAEKTAAADREKPKKGCNGYPFSRMKRAE
ncbi:hypothetical protein [Pedobacter sp.]|uniref:hypothetical protein n=1 Tax=Pedobacter sp. TaxID=1411316 RepID=UPI00396C2E61